MGPIFGTASSLIYGMGLVGFDFPGDFRATVAFNSCTCRQVWWTGPQVVRLKIVGFIFSDSDGKKNQ